MRGGKAGCESVGAGVGMQKEGRGLVFSVYSP